MSEGGGGATPTPTPAPAAGGGDPHALSFKLRFAAQREPGRSYVSLVKPLGLPATVTGKFYTQPPATDAEAERRVLTRIRGLFERGPRERLPAPLTESHVYGWWTAREHSGAPAAPEPRLSHHIRDSAWLKARLLVLAADEKLNRK